MQLNGRTLSVAEKNEVIARGKIHLGLGRSDEEICKREGWSIEEWRVVKRAAYQSEIERVKSMTPDEQFAEYRLAAFASIDQLNDVITDQKGGNQPNAIVGAVNAKMQIFKSMIEIGQDFGLVEKKAASNIKGLLVAGVDLTKMTPQEARNVLESELVRMNNLINTASKGVIEVAAEKSNRKLPKKP